LILYVKSFAETNHPLLGQSSTTLVNFIAAMITNPEVQAKAQQEIDTVLGPATLPTMADRERLPYVNNLILEVLRWRPVAPNGKSNAL
jgi:cytochrome P450